jgi:hypothetical protein
VRVENVVERHVEPIVADESLRVRADHQSVPRKVEKYLRTLSAVSLVFASKPCVRASVWVYHSSMDKQVTGAPVTPTYRETMPVLLSSYLCTQMYVRRFSQLPTLIPAFGGRMHQSTDCDGHPQ